MSMAVTNSQPSLKRHVGTWPEQRETRGVSDLMNGGTSRKMNVLAFFVSFWSLQNCIQKCFLFELGMKKLIMNVSRMGWQKVSCSSTNKHFGVRRSTSTILDDISHASNIQKRWTNMRSLFESIENICFLFKRNQQQST